MKNKLVRTAKDTNLFLKKFIKKQKRTELVDSHGSMAYFQEGKKLDQKFY